MPNAALLIRGAPHPGEGAAIYRFPYLFGSPTDSRHERRGAISVAPGCERRWHSIMTALPMGLLLGLASVPLGFLLAQFSINAIEWSSFEPTMRFAIGGATVSIIAGGAKTSGSE